MSSSGFPWHRRQPAPVPIPTLIDSSSRRAFLDLELWDLLLASLPPHTTPERREAIDIQAKEYGRTTKETALTALRGLVEAEWVAASNDPA